MFEGIKYTQTEINFYNYLFDTNTNPNNNYIEGKEVVRLFMKANLQRDKLKIIWDNSSKRKAQNLSKEEFYYSCRSVALAQIGMELNDFNVKQMNNSSVLPTFNGISFSQPINNTQHHSSDNVTSTKSINSTNTPPLTTTAKKVEEDDDDEFVTIEENVDKEIKPKESIKQVELNIVNSLLKDFDVNKQKKKEEEQKPMSQPKPPIQLVVEEIKPKKKLDDLFDLLDTNDEKKNNEEKENTTIEGDNQFNMKNHQKSIENNMNDPALKESFDNKPNEAMAANKAIDLENIFKQQLPNLSYFTPQTENITHQVFPSNEIDLNNEANSNKKNDNSLNAITSVINKAKTMNVNDLMNGLEFEFTNENKTSEIMHQKSVHLDDNLKKKEEPIDDDEDDFCEVEEEDQQNENNTQLTTQKEIITQGQNNYIISQTLNPIDSIISDSLQPNKDEIEEVVQEVNQSKERQNVINDSEQSNDIPLKQENKEVKEEKKPTPSILNFTQMDFLQEFKKEITPNAAQENEKEDDFEFIEVEEKSNPTPIKPSDNPIESKLSKNFKSDEVKAKFQSNLTLVFKAINKEYTTIIPFLKELMTLSDIKCSDDSLFKNKRLSNFINGTIKLLLFNNKFKGTKEFLNNSKLETNQKNYDEIISLIKVLSQSKNFESIIAVNKLNELNTIPKIKDNDGNEDSKDCQLCLHSNSNERITNVFGYDFHIRCINVWLNLIEAKSPFIS